MPKKKKNSVLNSIFLSDNLIILISDLISV